MRTRIKLIIGIGATAMTCLLVAGAFASNSHGANSDVRHSVAGAAADLSAAFRNIATEVTPSVVSVNSVQKVKVNTGLRGLHSIPEGSPLERFFGDDLSQLFFHPPTARNYVREGLGTGVIIDPHGYVLTNNHVVEGADEVTVKLSDNRQFKAEIVGSDPKTDIAVLKIKGKNLTAASLGDSDQLEVGEWVAAVGNPVRPDVDDHRRHRQRQGQIGRGHHGLRGLHPDGRGDQSRQQRGAARQSVRAGDRHQHGDRHAQWRVPGRRICDSDQHGPEHHGQPDT